VLIERHGVARLRRGRIAARIDLRGRPAGVTRVHIVMRLRNGRRVVDTRRYHLCAARSRTA
jgi:hypothetical protein